MGLRGYARKNSDEFLFAEAIGGEVTLTDDQRQGVARMPADLTGFLQSAIDDGTFAPSKLLAIMSVLTAPAMQLARRAAFENVAPDMMLAKDG